MPLPRSDAIDEDDEPADAAAVKRVLAGDIEAFTVLVRRYHRRLSWYVASKLSDETTAADVVQRAFVTLYQQLRAYDPDRPLFTWLRAIALNHCRNAWRSLRHQAELKDRVLHVLRAEGHLRALEAEAEGEDEARLAALRRCLAGLGEEERRLVQLRFYEDRELSEIGSAVGRSAEGVRVSLFRLRQRLADCIRRRLAPGGGA